MLGKSFRKLGALLLLLIGVMFVRSVIDATPVIGSPQIDYPGFDFDLPFWPQLGLHWLLFGAAGGLLVALAMLAWSDEPPGRPGLRRVAMVWTLWVAAVSGFQLANFLAWGTMGPLNVQQPIFRFALVNGLISATVITLQWTLASALLWRAVRDVSAFKSAAVGFGLVFASFTSVALAVMVLTGLPPLRLLGDLLPAVAILALATALLVGLTPRAQLPSTSKDAMVS